DGYWSSWQPWTPCSATCGDGVRRRIRSCIGPLYGGRRCNGDDYESLLCSEEKCEHCNTHQCPIDGYWSSWQPWTPCSATCGDGVRQRIRSCIGPFYEGRICNADDHESLLCKEKC
ncbi:hypothetical protein CAPTEDRAFT_44848, partial [Capitella teleta]